MKPVSKLPDHTKQLVLKLNEDQLYELLNLASDRLRLFHKARALYAMKDFQILDRVYFDYHGERKEGTVIRLNQRTITIRLINGEIWKVAPDFLIKLLKEINFKPGKSVCYYFFKRATKLLSASTAFVTTSSFSIGILR